MRILVLSPHHESCYSGPAVLLERLLSSVVSNATAVIIGPGEYRQSTPSEVRYVRLSGASKHTALGRLRWMLKASLWAWCHAEEADVVHLHGTYIHELLPAVVLRLKGVPYVLFPLSETGDLRKDSRSSRLPGIRILRRFLVSRSALGFSLAPRISDELCHWGLAEERIINIANPASPAFFVHPEESDARCKVRTVGFVGKVLPRKQPLLIVAALALLHQRGWREARALFIGPFSDPHYQSQFERAVAALGLEDKVRVTGYIDDVAPLLRTEVSVFVLPSLTEGLPGALTEAMSAGLPCAVSDAGSMPDIVRASGGGAVLARSGEAIADFIDSIWRDCETWDRYSAAAYDYALEHFSPRSVADTYLQALRRTVGQDVAKGETYAQFL